MKLAAKMGMAISDADIMEAYIPDGVASYIIRIPGQGRFMVNMKPEGISITNMRNTSEKSPLTWQEFKDVLLEDMKVRDFPEEKKEKKKDGKVKPAKPKENRYVEEVKKYHEQQEVAPVQQEEKTEEPAEIQNEESAEQCQDNVPQEEISDGLSEISEENNVMPVFQTQFLNKLEKIQKEASGEDPNWGYVKDHLQDLIRDINLNAGGWRANERE